MPHDLVRLPPVPPIPGAKFVCKEGDTVEVRFRIVNFLFVQLVYNCFFLSQAYVRGPESDTSYGWHQAKVLQMKGEFAVLDISTSVQNKDIVSVEKIRSCNRNPHLNAASFKRTLIPVPEDLRD